MQKQLFELGRMDIIDLYEWYVSEKLNANAYFQRQSVWKEKDRVDLIDTILKGLPIPSIFLCEASTDLTHLKKKYNILDGRQRLESIFNFIDNKFKYNGKSFGELDSKDQEKITNYSIPIVQIYIKPEATEEIKEIFKRLNKNSYNLNKIEKTSSQFVEYRFMTICKILTGNIQFENIDSYMLEMEELFSDDNQETNEGELELDLNDDNNISEDIKELTSDEKIKNIKENLSSVGLIYTDYQVRRQVPLQHIMNILSSLIEKEPIGRNINQNKIAEYSEIPNIEFSSIIHNLEVVNKILNELYSKYDDLIFWRNTTCYFSLTFMIYFNLDKIISVDYLVKVLKNFEKSDYFNEFKRLTQERGNDKVTRVKRNKMLEEALLSV